MASIARSGRRLCAELLEDRRQLAAVTVTTHLDVVNAGDGLISLREAIQTTNTASGADEIYFDASLSGKTISLQAGELNITDALTVNGMGAADLAISGNGASRVFSIGMIGPASGTPLEVTLSGLTIKNGRATVGGGIYSQENLTLIDSIVADNKTVNGAEFYNENGGAGIYAWGWGRSITTTIIRSEIRNNSATGMSTFTPKGSGGGGIASNGGLRIFDSVIANNLAGDGLAVGVGQGKTPGDGGDGGGIIAVGSVEIHGTTISGNAAGKGSQGSGMGSYGAGGGGNGGGLHVTGSLSITESVLDGNTTGIGGAVTYNRSGHSGNGGGIWYKPTLANDSLNISDSTVSNNRTANGQVGGFYGQQDGANSGHGGGVYATGLVSIQNSTFSANETGQGGAAFKHPAFLGAKTGGSAGHGGGLWLGGASAKTIANSTISGNFGGRGGTDVEGAKTGNGGSGGGVWFEGTGSLAVAHSTVADNRAGERGVQSALGLGGGLRGQGGGIYHSGVAGTAVTLNHSIVALNVAGVDAPVDHSDLAGAEQFVAVYSLIGTNAGASIVSGSGTQIGIPGTEIDPLLGPLADNGGPTQTRALLAGSPALDAGNPALVAGTGSTPTEDQRGAGHDRIVGTAIDLGSFEVASTALPPDADFDDNAFVDGNDFLLWQRGAGDADGDTDSDGDDLQAWADAFGQPIPPLEATAAGALVAAIVANEETVSEFNGTSDLPWLNSLAGSSLVSGGFSGRSAAASLALRKESRWVAFEQFRAAKSESPAISVRINEAFESLASAGDEVPTEEAFELALGDLF